MILVGGGSGFVGRHLVRQLRASGHKVTVVSRSPGPESVSWADVERAGLPDGCRAVVNLAGRNILEASPYLCLTGQRSSYRQELVSSRVGTTRTLAQAIDASANPPAVFVNASAVGYYDPREPAPQDEESPGGAHDDFLAPLVADWERAAAVAKPEATRPVIVRLGVVLGRDGGLIQRTYLPFFLGLGGRTGSGRQWLPWVHVDDVVGILRFALTNSEVHGVLNAVAPHGVTNGEFAAAFGRALGRPAVLPMPAFTMKLAFGDRAKVVMESARVVPKRTLEYGYQFKFPTIDEAMRNIVSGK